jgi:hypothetical protein
MGKKIKGWRVKFNVTYRKESGKKPEFRWYSSSKVDPEAAKDEGTTYLYEEKDIFNVTPIKTVKIK